MATIMHAPAISAQRRTLWKDGHDPASPAQAGPAAALPPAQAQAQAQVPAQGDLQEEVAAAHAGAAPNRPAGPVQAQPGAPQAARAQELEQARLHELEREQVRLREQEARASALQREQEQALRRQREEREQELANVRAAAYEEGFAAGDKDARRGHAELHQRLDTLLGQLQQQLEQAMAVDEEMGVAIAFEVVCKVIGAAVVTREGVLAQLREVVARTREREQLRIHLHPDDLALVRQGPTPGIGRGGAVIEWVGDDTLTCGGCVVGTSGGDFDARLERQLAQFKDALLQARQAAALARGEPDADLS